MRATHRRQLRQTIAVQRPVAGTLDAYGRPTWGAPAQMAARVEQTNQVFDNADGTRLVGDVMVIVEAEIALTDRVWLPPDAADLTALDASKANSPKKIFERVNADGTTSHYEVHL